MVQAILAATLIGAPSSMANEPCLEYRGVAVISLGMPGQFLVMVKPAGVAWESEDVLEPKEKQDYRVIFHLFHKDRDYDIFVEHPKSNRKLFGGESDSFDSIVNAPDSTGATVNNGFGVHDIY